MMLPLLCIVGPTASGKTALSIRMAKQLGGEIVSADSMQIYEKMDIATAKPTPEEMDGVPHHLIGVLPLNASCSVAEYADMARGVIAEITARGRLPILVGGTGLYISAIVDNIIYSPAKADLRRREELQALAAHEGNDAVFAILKNCDPAAAERLHPNNLGRVIRAIEVYETTGKPIGDHDAESQREPSPYDCCQIGLTYADREHLYERIGLRVDRMMEAGLLTETKQIRALSPGKTASQAIGYKELGEYLEGRCSLPEAVELLKRDTRRYAKRQLTWFRRDGRIRWLCCDEYTPDGLFESGMKIYEAHYGGEAR